MNNLPLSKRIENEIEKIQIDNLVSNIEQRVSEFINSIVDVDISNWTNSISLDNDGMYWGVIQNEDNNLLLQLDSREETEENRTYTFNLYDLDKFGSGQIRIVYRKEVMIDEVRFISDQIELKVGDACPIWIECEWDDEVINYFTEFYEYVIE